MCIVLRCTDAWLPSLLHKKRIGYSTMCGHRINALVTALLETGAFPAKGCQTQVNLDIPAILVRETANLDNNEHVKRVSFLNVPSFLYARDVELLLPNYGKLIVDVAFVGAFYAFISAGQVSLKVTPENTAQLVLVGEAIKKAVNDIISIQHPIESDLSFVYGTILTDVPENPAHHSRNVCVFADSEEQVRVSRLAWLYIMPEVKSKMISGLSLKVSWVLQARSEDE